MYRVITHIRTWLRKHPGMYQATGTFQPLTDAGNSALLADIFGGGGDLGSFLQGAFQIAIAVGAIAAVLRITWAGFLYMTSDIAGKKEDAKKAIQEAVIGLLLLLGVVLILQQVNPEILNLDFSLTPVSGIWGTPRV